MYLIQYGTVHIGDGTVLNNCDILVSDGKIARMGVGLACPEAAVIDGKGRHIFPGFIDPASSIGAMGLPSSYPDNNEKSNPVTPEMNIKYSMDPDELNNQEFYKSGITSVGLTPGNANVIGGQMAVFKTAPMRMKERLVKEQAGLKCCVTAAVKDAYGKRDKLPMTKMGIFHLLEKSLREAKNTGEQDRTVGQNVVLRAIDGELPFFISAETKGEIDGVLHLFRDIEAPVNLIDAYAFGGDPEALMEKKTGIVLGNISNLSRITKHGMELSLLKKLVKNGNRLAFTGSSGGCSEGREVLLWTAIDVYRAGVDAEEVIKMLTSNPAKMLGVYDRLGSLEIGKDADLSIYTAHPILTYAARVEHCMINGEVVF